VVQFKQWVATLDDRVRDTHLDLDGEIVPLGEPFTAGGYSAQNPGEFGIASQDINCRCTIVAAFPEAAAAGKAAAAVWKKFDADLRDWEKALEKGLQKGFRDQGKEFLEAMSERT